ncbi:N-acetyltransferase [Actinobacteria bacterium YIM 96077]|uniref:Lysine N-acyltransferase MbtK n=1 Tax=Phytoactinopolyspora halophila TaxID=1981511 RepID=A0A329QNR3_9ACTN|nr:GNAT family N-acetyltransferase [Phytoactinopolyspora halophila]AYY14609.1 N-acetyltransferase [Actinobacteria bacterium YIM 96077]RAW14014.1 GNAT family N-acetyltransferase [Phytoactinopolyspora halophila]
MTTHTPADPSAPLPRVPAHDDPAVRTGPAPWTATVAGSAVTLAALPARADEHGELVHDWMNRAHVAPWWQLDRSLDEIRAYLTGLTHLQPWIVYADGRPFGYVETYRAVEDDLASYYAARPGDVGWHLLIGPEDVLGSGLARLLGHAFLAYLFTRGDRVVCEPDVRNARMHAFCRRLGFEAMAEIGLPDKRALLMSCSRQAYAELFPAGTAVIGNAHGQWNGQGVNTDA